MEVPLLQVPLQRPPRRVLIMQGSHGPGVMRFHLPTLWCVHLYRYQASLTIGPHALRLRPGTLGLIPAGWTQRYDFPRRLTHVCAHVELDPRGLTTPIPALTPLGERFESTHALMQSLLTLDNTPHATAALWALLWSLTPRRDDVLTRTPVEAAIAAIEQQLDRPLRIEALARTLGLSHNHLIRLFRKALGTTPRRYLVQRRAQRAMHLLTQSTTPIKAIAAEVGLPDPHQFNKLIRRELGASPRALRERSLKAPPAPAR